MSAIITESFRRNSAQLFLNDIITTGDSTTAGPAYYVGIGKSDAWDVNEEQPTFNVSAARGTAADSLEVMNNLSTLKKITSSAAFNVFPNIAFTPGKKYKAYDPNDDSCFYASGGFLPCFVTTSAGTFLCLVQGNTLTGAQTSPSTVGGLWGITLSTNSDGYIWAFVQPVNSLFVTEQFLSVGTDLLPDSPEAVSAKNETGGYVYGFSVLNGGVGYTIQDSFKLVNPDSTAESYDLTPILDNTGSIVSLSVTGLTTNQLQFPSLTSVSIVSAAGSGAVIIPKQAPLDGFGYSPKNDLPTWYAALDVSFADDVDGDALYSPYRQISVIKNPKVQDEDSGSSYPYTAKATRYLKIASAPASSISIGDAIKLSANGPIVAHVDSVSLNENDNRIYFHQNYSSGFTQFTDSMSIYIGPGNTLCTTVSSNSVKSGEYTIGTGSVLFTENRKKITRSSGQSEQIKIIIQF